LEQLSVYSDPNPNNNQSFFCVTISNKLLALKTLPVSLLFLEVIFNQALLLLSITLIFQACRFNWQTLPKLYIEKTKQY
jgi:hypothetical protein